MSSSKEVVKEKKMGPGKMGMGSRLGKRKDDGGNVRWEVGRLEDREGKEADSRRRKWWEGGGENKVAEGLQQRVW